MKYLKNRTTAAVAGFAAVSALALAACSADGDGTTAAGGGGGDASAEDITITWAGWDANIGLEFISLTEAFNALDNGITVEVVDYMTTGEYRTALTADLAAGTAPDILTLIDVPHFVTLAEGNQLREINDVVAGLDERTHSRDLYTIDEGENFLAVPFRQDFWVLYYNAALFEEMGVPAPDGTWTWDDFVSTARDLQAVLPDGVFPNYQHHWESTVGGFALAQTPGADLFSGDFSWLAPQYELALTMQDERLQPSFGTQTTGSLHHRAEFGQQRAAMVNMGTWFMSQVVDSFNLGEAEAFDWRIAPVPQRDASTVDAPVTFGTPTGMAINNAIPDERLDAAKEFLAFVAGEGGAKALGATGLIPPLLTEEVIDVIFAVEGMPADELSKQTFLNAVVVEQNPVSPNLPIVATIRNEMHSAVMTESITLEAGIEESNERFARDRVN